jgi:hypothetical protein
VSQVPGWHTTIFPPYFVAGAIFSGFGMVLTLLIPLRTICKLEDVITVRHIELMCKVILATGSMVGYAYGMEFFIAWYGGNPYERYASFTQPGLRTLLVGLLDHDLLQRDLPAAVLVQVVPNQDLVCVHGLDLREHRHVVRAVRDHRHVAASRLPAFELGLLQPNLGGHHDVRGQLRVVHARCSYSSCGSCRSLRSRDSAGDPQSVGWGKGTLNHI